MFEMCWEKRRTVFRSFISKINVLDFGRKVAEEMSEIVGRLLKPFDSLVNSRCPHSRYNHCKRE